ncbi:hypothetical protein Scep_007248 [Stephania cephalantha]|uniref:Uncharacterized protein n=1 Tax=Stephania cephalantha TaxID=152367 RepID=A0AAP0K9G8_9MAGN
MLIDNMDNMKDIDKENTKVIQKRACKMDTDLDTDLVVFFEMRIDVCQHPYREPAV